MTKQARLCVACALRLVALCRVARAPRSDHYDWAVSLFFSLNDPAHSKLHCALSSNIVEQRDCGITSSSVWIKTERFVSSLLPLVSLTRLQVCCNSAKYDSVKWDCRKRAHKSYSVTKLPNKCLLQDTWGSWSTLPHTDRKGRIGTKRAQNGLNKLIWMKS